MKRIPLGLGALLLVGQTACGQKPAPAADDSAVASTALGQKVREATDKAREEMATSNIRVSEGASTLPKAEITPQGDLLIAGKRVAIDEQQRQLLLQHRAIVVAIAEAGIEIGVQGADLGVKAAGEAIKGIFSGNTEEIEKNIEAQAEKIELAAARLCRKLPALKDSQQALAAAIPEFKPYATMNQSNIDDCGKHNTDYSADPAQRAKVQTEIRNDIREGIRATIRGTVRQPSSPDTATSEDAAAQADAAATQATSSADTNKH